MINAIETLFSQALIIVLNYVLSKLLVFKDKNNTQRCYFFLPRCAKSDNKLPRLLSIFP